MTNHKSVLKAGEGILKPILEQLPDAMDGLKMEKRVKRRKRIKKSWPDEDGFNAKAAQEAYDLVMKMDEEDAREFTSMVVRDVLDDTIEKNLPAVQAKVNTVVSKCLNDLKKATYRTAIAKRGVEGIGYASAVRELEEIIKAKNPYDYGYVFRESDFKRDPKTGRFQVKVSHAQKKPLHPGTAKTIGIGGLGDEGYKKLNTADRAKYQDEYRQLSMFLDAVHASSQNPGDSDIYLHFRQDQTGQPFTVKMNGTKVPKDLLQEEGTTLVGVEAKPNTLTLGGAAFGLSGALGSPVQGGTVRGLNQVESGMSSFAQEWSRPSDGAQYNSNERMYRRLASGSSYLSQIAPAGSKVQMAAKFGEFVGSHGPEAEQVFGPPTRKAAYRYRGTERTPDSDLISAYAGAIGRAKSRNIEESRTHQMGLARVSAERRSPTWDERNEGRAVVQGYLRSRLPKKGLYNLQLASGNVPPSEGVVINSEGQLTTQAVGYGDDHYLPFNLKHLKSLKGGEYIRSRSVGGPTSEDIYTGLMSGARRVTVVSRSGTFVVEFEPDFRGGRRYNDKARRMVRRYEQILDAVQSQQVERADVAPEIRTAITSMVRERYSGLPGVDRAEIRNEINREIEDFKNNPEISEEDDRIAQHIINMRTQNQTTPDTAQIRGQVYNDLAAEKEFKFRLNGTGYAAALEALQEQFPYYLKVNSVPTKEPERALEPEIDRGYVEPGRNRPTQALAGLYGASAPSRMVAGGKFSAREADYQGGRRTAPGGGALAPVPEANKKPEEKETFQSMVAEHSKERSYINSASAIQEWAKKGNVSDVGAEELNYSADDLRKPSNQAKFDAYAMRLFQVAADNGRSSEISTLRNDYLASAGHLNGKDYDKKSRGVWGAVPAKFEGAEYQASAPAATRVKAIREIDSRTKSGVVYGKPLSEMTEDQMKAEHTALSQLLDLREVADEMSERTGTKVPIPPDALRSTGVTPGLPGVDGLSSTKAIQGRIDDLHRMRALLAITPEQERTVGTVILSATRKAEDYSDVRKTVKNLAESARKAARYLEDETTDERGARRLHEFADSLEDDIDQVHSDADVESLMEANGYLIDEVNETFKRMHRGGAILR